MDTAGRARLVLPLEEPSVYKGFNRVAGRAVQRGITFVKDNPNGVPVEWLAQWTQRIDNDAIGSFKGEPAIVCAITGSYYGAIANTMTGRAIRRYIGSLGQTRLTMALMLLHPADRSVLFQPRAIVHSAEGSLAVAELAAALTAAGGECWLPTAHEDADLKIDLLCWYNGRLLCIQVKRNTVAECHVASAYVRDEHEFVQGVRKFSRLNNQKAIPLWVSMRSFLDASSNAMYSEESIAFAEHVLSYTETITRW